MKKVPSSSLKSVKSVSGATSQHKDRKMRNQGSKYATQQE